MKEHAIMYSRAPRPEKIYSKRSCYFHGRVFHGRTLSPEDDREERPDIRGART